MASLDISSRSLVFRGAVIVGAVALLVGVAGIFYFRARDGDRRSARPRDACTVMVRGLSSLEGVEVDVTWLDASGAPATDVGRPGHEPGTWAFLGAPEGAPVTLRVRRRAEGTAEILHQQPAVLTRGALFEVWLPGPR